MPTPTIMIPFGDSTTSTSVFAKVELDSEENIDENGEEISNFYDTELVNILVHMEPGVTIKSISTSLGNIINSTSAKTVTRKNVIEEVQFKGLDEVYTVPHYPSSGISIKWIGRSRNVTISGREITCKGGAGICNISYRYTAKQYILQVPLLGLKEDEEFPVEVSFKIEK